MTSQQSRAAIKNPVTTTSPLPDSVYAVASLLDHTAFPFRFFSPREMRRRFEDGCIDDL